MSDPALPVPIETLLRERAWVRGLARSLVRDENAADDLEQDAWVAALERPPADTTSPRGWLATVLRRGAGRGRRGSYRRDRRERAASRAEAVPAAADVVEQAEWHGRVVRAVLALDEPYRSTLLLRYFEDLPPRDVAARTGVPVETVRSRAQRGLARVREGFDAEAGGERRAWAVPVAALAGPALSPVEGPGAGGGGGGGGAEGGAGRGAGTTSAAAAAAKGVLAMTTAAKVGAAGFALAAAVGVFFLLRDRGEGGRAGSDGNTWTPVAKEGDAPGLARGAGSPRPAEAGAMETVAPAPASAAGAGSLAGRTRVVEAPEETGAALAGATVIGFDATGARHEARTDASGTIFWPAGTGPFASGWAFAPGHAMRRFERLDVAAGTRLALEKDAGLRVRFTLDGVDLSPEEARRRFEVGGGTAGQVWWIPEEMFSSPDPAHLFRLWMTPPETWRTGGVVSYAAEGATLEPAPSAGVWWMAMGRPGDEPVIARVDFAASRETTVPLRARVESVRMRAVDADTGAAIPGATAVAYAEIGDDRVFVPATRVTADAHGEWEAPVPAETRGGRNATWWVTSPGRAAMVSPYEVRAAKGGSLDVRLPRTATIRGRAYLPSGLPAVGRAVSTMAKGWAISAVVDADGAFVLEDVPAMRKATVAVTGDLAKMEFTLKEVDVVPGGESTVTFGAPKGSTPTGVLRGRLTAGGVPLAGVLLGVGKKGASGFATTDADGRWLAEGIPAGETSLFVMLGVAGVADDFSIQSKVAIRVDAGAEVVRDFDLPGGVLRVRVIDDVTGKPIARAYVLASPRDRDAERGRFPGFVYGSGWCAATDDQGVVTLPGLVPGAPHAVMAVRPGDRAEGKADAVTAGTAQAPGEVTVRVRKKE